MFLLISCDWEAWVISDFTVYELFKNYFINLASSQKIVTAMCVRDWVLDFDDIGMTVSPFNIIFIRGCTFWFGGYFLLRVHPSLELGLEENPHGVSSTGK